MPIRILLVDDHAILCAGLRSLLAGEPGLEVVGEAPDGRTAVELVQRLTPQIVVMDIGMPDLNGIDATSQIKRLSPQTKIIALSTHSDKRYVSGILKAGADGYVLKNDAFLELVRAVHAVLRGQTYLCPAVAGVVVTDYLNEHPAAAAAAPRALTEREREIVQLIAEGSNTKSVAARLHISPKTVETHRQRIMQKLEFQSVAELVKYAIREGLTSP